MEIVDNNSETSIESHRPARINICGLLICASIVIVTVAIISGTLIAFLYSNEKQTEKDENKTLELSQIEENISSNELNIRYKPINCEYSISTLNKDRSVLGHLPWEISLAKQYHFCIASIISEKWALTAAHCFDEIGHPKEWSHFKVFSDSLKTTKRNDSVTNRRAIKIIKHPLYDDNDVVNDIAVILVDPPFKYRFHGQGGKRAIAPVCLPEEHEEFLYREAIISGIGRRERNSTINVLISSKTKIIEDEYCLSAFGKRYKYKPPSHICAALPNNKIGPCKGDSGGPVVVIEQKRIKQIGLISFGKRCTNNTPSVLTNVAFYRSWLKEQTGL